MEDSGRRLAGLLSIPSRHVPSRADEWSQKGPRSTLVQTKTNMFRLCIAMMAAIYGSSRRVCCFRVSFPCTPPRSLSFARLSFNRLCQGRGVFKYSLHNSKHTYIANSLCDYERICVLKPYENYAKHRDQTQDTALISIRLLASRLDWPRHRSRYKITEFDSSMIPTAVAIAYHVESGRQSASGGEEKCVTWPKHLHNQQEPHKPRSLSQEK